MPADFGFATATFIVIAGMVGTGILTTSGFTVLDVGSNQWMLLLWVLGGITAICGASDVGRAVGGSSKDRWGLRLSLRRIRAVAGVSYRGGCRF